MSYFKKDTAAAGNIKATPPKRTYSALSPEEKKGKEKVSPADKKKKDCNMDKEGISMSDLTTVLEKLLEKNGLTNISEKFDTLNTSMIGVKEEVVSIKETLNFNDQVIKDIQKEATEARNYAKSLEKEVQDLKNDLASQKKKIERLEIDQKKLI